jgi:hypothetical protein
VDFDTLTWKETFWDGPKSEIAVTTWKLTETSWAKFDPAYVPPARLEEKDTETNIASKMYVKDESILYQRVTIPLDDVDYIFVAEYTWDGTTFDS